MKKIVIAFFAIVGVAFGRDYVELTAPVKVVMADGIVLDALPGDCFPLAYGNGQMATFCLWAEGKGRMWVTTDTANVRKVFEDENSRARNGSALNRMVAEYNDRKRIATEPKETPTQKADRELADAKRREAQAMRGLAAAEDSLREFDAKYPGARYRSSGQADAANRAPAETMTRERVPTQRNGQPLPPNWIDPDEADRRVEEDRIRAMENRLNHLQSQQIMRQQNGQP